MIVDAPSGAALLVARSAAGSVSGELRGAMRFIDGDGQVATCALTTFSLMARGASLQ